MKKLIVFFILTVAASTYAQTTDFFELVKTGTAAADTDSYRSSLL